MPGPVHAPLTLAAVEGCGPVPACVLRSWAATEGPGCTAAWMGGSSWVTEQRSRGSQVWGMGGWPRESRFVLPAQTQREVWAFGGQDHRRLVDLTVPNTQRGAKANATSAAFHDKRPELWRPPASREPEATVAIASRR